jgi:hypothetical protein
LCPTFFLINVLPLRGWCSASTHLGSNEDTLPPEKAMRF